MAANLAMNGILEKDEDYKYMATSDLLNELNKDSFKPNSDLEIKLSNIIIQQLNDVAGDVLGLAVKCLALLVKKVSEARVMEMANKLYDKLLNGKDHHQDIASIALKTIVAEVATQSLAQPILAVVTPQLIKGITGPVMSTEIKCECLDILCDVLRKFGNLMVANQDLVLVALLSQLNSNQASVKKKIVSCIDHYHVKMPCHLILSKLADKCPSAILAVLDSLIDPLKNTINFKPKLDAIKQEVDRNEDMIRNALCAIASLSRISGGDCSLEFKNLMTEISRSPALWEKYYSIRNEGWTC